MYPSAAAGGPALQRTVLLLLALMLLRWSHKKFSPFRNDTYKANGDRRESQVCQYVSSSYRFWRCRSRSYPSSPTSTAKSGLMSWLRGPPRRIDGEIASKTGDELVASEMQKIHAPIKCACLPGEGDRRTSHEGRQSDKWNMGLGNSRHAGAITTPLLTVGYSNRASGVALL